MKINMEELGSTVKENSVTFKQFLPGIDREARVLAVGSFCDWEPENSVLLRYNSEKDIWEGSLDDLPKGIHEYAYLIKTSTWRSNPAMDLYAKMTGANGYSAFQIPREAAARINHYTPPSPDELILYYLNLDDFNENFEGVKNRVMYYLSQLGINGVVFSPWVGHDHDVSNEKIPIHYFAPDNKYGTPYELKVMINECHKANIAVIMEVDFSAVSKKFGTNNIYPLFENKPLLGRIDESGKKIYLDFNDEMTQEFVYGVCRFWLEEYNVDGFRFLNSQDYWDGADGNGLAAVSRKIYEYAKKRGRDDIYLFSHHTGYLGKEILNKSYINAVENESFLRAIHRMAENRTLAPNFWRILDVNQVGLSGETKMDDNLIKNYAIYSTEDDENSSLIVKMGIVSGQRDWLGRPVGDRKNHWWKVKPYVIAQFTCNGIPMIHNGQEIAENQYGPDRTTGKFESRPISWHFLADFAGKDMYRFYQKLIILRTLFPSIRSTNFFHFFTDPEHQVIVFKRYLDDETVIVAINFSNESYDVVIQFPGDGVWREYLDDYEIDVEGRSAVVRIPARYGSIFYRE